MPFTALFATVKFPVSTVEEKPRVLANESRVAEPISTSEGEFAREGTLIVRKMSESWEKM